jgi:hypothetical protein
MPVIHVPRPSKKAGNQDRPANALLLAQVQHLQYAERRLPLRYRSEIYTHAIKTEREAARYIQEITEAIHQAHADAAAKRVPKRKHGLTIAAAAERPSRKTRSKIKTKTSKRGRRK